MGEGTFAGTRGNDKVAPLPDLRALAAEPEIRHEAIVRRPRVHRPPIIHSGRSNSSHLDTLLRRDDYVR
jgi:hypothetical protein